MSKRRWKGRGRKGRNAPNRLAFAKARVAPIMRHVAGIALSDEQQAAIDAAIQALSVEGRDLFRIGGYAGTGKTTIAKWFVHALGSVAVCAFTGKAASVLRRKGLDGHTIHRTIYRYDEATREFRRLPGIDADYVLVDEGSMVSQVLWDDLTSFGKPILVIGDPGQLEPVGDDPCLMRDPDVVLQTIHRQASGNTIIEFADKVRRGLPFRYGTKGQVSIRPRADADADLDWADQYLCGFNRTRVAINHRIRERRGFWGSLREGERIICLQNNQTLGVFNGQMFTTGMVSVGPYPETVKVDLRDDDGNVMDGVVVWLGNFGRERMANRDELFEREDQMIADWGYCTTVHKFQGSEESKVVVIDEQCKMWDASRWRYTAITRAMDELRFYF